MNTIKVTVALIKVLVSLIQSIIIQCDEIIWRQTPPYGEPPINFLIW